MKNPLSVITLATAMALCTNASAGNHIEEVWDCTLTEGKTLDEVKSVNANWMKYVNKNVRGSGISSRIVTPLVGDLGSFIFVDSFPNLVSWADTKAAMQSDEGQKIEAKFDELSNCTSNRLYTSTQ